MIKAEIATTFWEASFHAKSQRNTRKDGKKKNLASLLPGAFA